MFELYLRTTLKSIMKLIVCLVMLCCLAPKPTPAQSVPSEDDVRVTVAVMDPQTVADVFGKRIARRFVGLQITIRNKSDEHQFLIQDVSLDLAKVFSADYLKALGDRDFKECQERLIACDNWNKALDHAANERDERLAKEARERDAGLDEAAIARNRALDDAVRARNRRQDQAAQQQCSCPKSDYQLSSLELSLLRGVAEKGQGQDPRNKVFRFLQALGTIAGGLVGVAGFGSSYGGSVAVFNGPVLSAYNNAFPDYTINQMNRLSDSAYQSNTLVPRQQAKVIVGFVSQSMFLSKKQRDTLWKDPTKLFEEIDFRRAEARVSGSFIVEINNLPPSVVAVQIDDDELKKFQNDKPSVKGYIAGRFSPDAKVNLLNQFPTGLSIKLDGTPASNRLRFIIESTKPVAPDTLLNFEVANDQAVQTISRPIHYKVDAPTIVKITPEEGPLNSPALSVEITGTNFVPGQTKVLVSDNGVRVVADSVDVISSTKLKAKLFIDRDKKDAPLGPRQITVANPTGESSSSVTFNVKSP